MVQWRNQSFVVRLENVFLIVFSGRCYELRALRDCCWWVVVFIFLRAFVLLLIHNCCFVRFWVWEIKLWRMSWELWSCREWRCVEKVTEENMRVWGWWSNGNGDGLRDSEKGWRWISDGVWYYIGERVERGMKGEKWCVPLMRIVIIYLY